jgi:beta-glucosidase-like glycosyl hydrolase
MSSDNARAGVATRRRLGAILAAGLASAVVLSTFPVAEPSQAAAASEPNFATQVGGTYDGMPLFDGNPEHLDVYLDVLTEYAEIEGAVRWAQGQLGDFTIRSGPNAGKVVPGAPRFAEGVQGIETDFPAQNAMGQTWNKDLVGEIGDVIGTEALYQDDFRASISDFNAMVSAGLQDMRMNPLSGRFDESFAEDPNLASDMIDVETRAISGIDAPDNADGFWTRAMVDTKHYTGYQAQWFRRPGSSDISARSLMEYWSPPATKSFQSGAIGSMLTTYGRTNGIPNSISPFIQHAEEQSPWGEHGGIYSTPDFRAERELVLPDTFSNGFDTQYTPDAQTALSLLTLAGAGNQVGGSDVSPQNAAMIEQIRNGTFGVTEADVYRVAKTQLVPLVRMGLFNERDSDGYPKHYPFLDGSALSPTPLDSSVEAHQQVALQAAQESLVLLKNDHDLLPLDKDSRLAVTGPFSDARFKTVYSVRQTPDLPRSGLTPVQGFREIFGDDAVTTAATDGAVVALRSVATDKYLEHADAASHSLTAGASDVHSAAAFETFDWGQEAFGYKSRVNNRWLRVQDGTTVNVGGTETFGTDNTAMPYRVRPESNADGTVSFVVESYTESFGGGFEDRYYTHGRYLTVDPATGQVGVTEPFGTENNRVALNTDATKFVQETVGAVGDEAVHAADDASDYAVVVVGHITRNSSGEGADRSDLHLGDDQYRLIEKVAGAYPEKTIVVVASGGPVILDDVQNNDDVAAIVHAPYNGQYGNLALGQLLAGDIAPSGRVTATWYDNMDALPEIDDYSIPEGPDMSRDLGGLDPRFTVDMTNGDPVEAGLTYMYTDAPVTYGFGHGLSYSDFTYKELTVEPAGQDTFTATVNVTNTGDVDSAEVVQLYAANPKAAYGDAAPKRRLVAFEKVTVPAGGSQEVTLTFGAEKLALWDSLRNELNVEAGRYDFLAGRSSENLQVKDKVDVAGVEFGALDASSGPVNVFDHSFAASNVTYREAAKQNTVEGLRDDRLVNGYYVAMSREPGAWTAINDVNLTDAKSVTLAVGSQNASSTVELRLDRPNGPKVADVTFGSTGAREYVIPGSTSAGDIPVKETAFEEVTVDLRRPVGGTHDLYLVFTEPDVRVKSVQLGVSASH